MKSKKKSGPQRGTGFNSRAYEKFMHDTTVAIQKLDKLRAMAQSRLRRALTEQNQLEETLRAASQKLLKTLLPDLTPRSLAKLDKEVPGFLTRDIHKKVVEAHIEKVPFFTWLFGRADDFRQERLSLTQRWLQGKLELHLETSTTLPKKLKDQQKAAREQREAARLRLKNLREREEKLAAQVTGLRRTLASFERNPRAVPTDMADAIRKTAAGTVGNGASSSRPARKNADQDSDLTDILIADILWDRYFNPRSGHYYDRAAERSAENGNSYRSPSVRDDDDRPSRSARPQDDGNASTRMRDADEAPRGDASMRMSDAAPSRGGSTGVRMRDPVIADPFSGSSRSEGNASARMSSRSESYSDRPERGSGTTY